MLVFQSVPRFDVEFSEHGSFVEMGSTGGGWFVDGWTLFGPPFPNKMPPPKEGECILGSEKTFHIIMVAIISCSACFLPVWTLLWWWVSWNEFLVTKSPGQFRCWSPKNGSLEAFLYNHLANFEGYPWKKQQNPLEESDTTRGHQGELAGWFFLHVDRLLLRVGRQVVAHATHVCGPHRSSRLHLRPWGRTAHLCDLTCGGFGAREWPEQRSAWRGERGDKKYNICTKYGYILFAYCYTRDVSLYIAHICMHYPSGKKPNYIITYDLHCWMRIVGSRLGAGWNLLVSLFAGINPCLERELSKMWNCRMVVCESVCLNTILLRAGGKSLASR